MKHILIISGAAGVGKDTFVEQLARQRSTLHIAIADLPKSMARLAGWGGEKTEKDRKFLSDLKVLIDEYNDGNYAYISKIARQFLRGETGDAELLCIDMREKTQIDRFCKDFVAHSVLILRPQVKHITSNIGDAGVFECRHDYEIWNDGSIEELYEKASLFLKDLDTTIKPAGAKWVYR